MRTRSIADRAPGGSEVVCPQVRTGANEDRRECVGAKLSRRHNQNVSKYKEIVTDEKWHTFKNETKFFPESLVVVLDKILERMSYEYLNQEALVTVIIH